MRTLFFIFLSLVMISCVRNNDNMLGNDVRLFKHTPVWDVAKAIEKGDSIAIRDLLMGEPDSLLNYQEKKFGQSLLEWAIACDHYESAKVLLELGADPNVPSNEASPMIEAAKMGTDYVKLLLKYGGDANAVSRSEKFQHWPTPLIGAAGNYESVRILIEAGADPNYIHITKNGARCAALQYAAISCNMDVIRYLIIDIKVNTQRSFDTTINGDSIYVVNYLRYCTYPLDSEEYRKKMEIVAFLKDQGMNYWETKVPQQFYRSYDSAYLEKY